MSEHTKGPWIHKIAGPNHWIEAPLGHTVVGRTIAYIGGKDNIFTIHPGTPHEANARLIAASPIMFKVCEDALDWIEGVLHVEPVDKYSTEIVDELKAAITEAGGE